MSGRDELIKLTNEKLKAKATEGKTETPINAEQVDAIFETVLDILKTGDRVMIQHFGSFVRKVQAPRLARNPQNGQKIEVPARVKLDLQATAPHFELNEKELEFLKKEEEKRVAAAQKAEEAKKT